MRVLLVEDDLTTSRGIVAMLKASAMVVDAVDAGEEALELARLYDYDIVVLDLVLPDMEGYEVVRRLRAARVPDIKENQRIAFDMQICKGFCAFCL